VRVLPLFLLEQVRVWWLFGVRVGYLWLTDGAGWWSNVVLAEEATASWNNGALSSKIREDNNRYL